MRSRPAERLLTRLCLRRPPNASQWPLRNNSTMAASTPTLSLRSRKSRTLPGSPTLSQCPPTDLCQAGTRSLCLSCITSTTKETSTSERVSLPFYPDLRLRGEPGQKLNRKNKKCHPLPPLSKICNENK